MQVETPSPAKEKLSSLDKNNSSLSLNSPTNLRLIASHKVSKDVSTLDFLRNSNFGLFYKKHLKQIKLINVISQWLWRNCYPLYVSHVLTHFDKNRNKRWRSVTKLRDYVRKNDLTLFKLVDSEIVETPHPKFFPARDGGNLISPHDYFTFPEIYVAVLKKASVFGGTNLVLADDEIICHDLYGFESDYTSEELHGRSIVDPRLNRVRWLLHDETPESLQAAAVFVDSCALNYAHWLTEVLPRIILFCAEEKFAGIPLIVNDGLHKNIMESLLLVTGASREVFILPADRELIVEELYVTSAVGYVPFDRRKKRSPKHSHGLFSPKAFEILCKHFDKQLNNLQLKVEGRAFPEKIYLRRNSGIRKVSNAVAIEKRLQEYGFEIVEPEKLTFSEQFQLFRNVKIIVGPTGAAFANLIFAQQDAKIIILISNSVNTSYWYWQNMACASGKTVSYGLGKVSSRTPNGIHSDFSIDLELLSEHYSNMHD